MSRLSRQLAVLALAFAGTAGANPLCQRVLARTYAAGGYTEGALHTLWGSVIGPESNVVDVFIDALEDAVSATASAQASTIRLALELEARHGRAFAAGVTPLEQSTALQEAPQGSELLEAWRKVGWRLSPRLREVGFGLVIRNGLPRELHLPPTLLGEEFSVWDFRRLLSRFPTVRRIGGISDDEALGHFAYVACVGHPGGVLEVERALLTTPVNPGHLSIVLNSIFRLGWGQPPKRISYQLVQVVERLPGYGPRLAAWLRGEAAVEEDFFGKDSLLDRITGLEELDHVWVAQVFARLYASLPADRQAALRAKILGRVETYGSARPFDFSQSRVVLDAIKQ